MGANYARISLPININNLGKSLGASKFVTDTVNEIEQIPPNSEEMGLKINEERKRRRGDSHGVSQRVSLDKDSQAQFRHMDIDGLGKAQVDVQIMNSTIFEFE